MNETDITGTSVDILFTNNQAYADGLPGPVPGPREPTAAVAVVTCMDCRVDMYAMLGLRPGMIHAIRNAGGIVTEDVLRSVALSQSRMDTREVMIVQHSDCDIDGVDPAGDTGLDASVAASVRAVRQAESVEHRDHVRGFIYDLGTRRLREVPVPD